MIAFQGLLAAKSVKQIIFSESCSHLCWPRSARRQPLFSVATSFQAPNYSLFKTSPFDQQLNDYKKLASNSLLLSSNISVLLSCRRPLSASLLPNVSPPEQPSDEERKKAIENQIRATKYGLGVLLFAIGFAAGYAVYSWGPPAVDEQGNVIIDEFSSYSPAKQYIWRAFHTLLNYEEVLKEPARELLLPDPLKPPYQQPPYTVVIESNGILVHPDWTYRTGWRFKKRPFVDYFLATAGPPVFELVVFTQDSGFTANPIIDSLDPGPNYISYRLFRDSTRYVNGVRVKDLNCLNRPLTRVIHVDWSSDACQLNRDNCLILKKWDGADGDKGLFDLAQFLRAIAAQDVDDVREVLAYYNKFDDPLEHFKEKQRQLAELEAAATQEASKKATSSSLVSSFKRK